MRVLIVDDELEWQELLMQVIKDTDEDIYLESAVDGFEAYHKVRWYKPDIVLMDVAMPGMDGIQLCRVMKANPESSQVRVIAITGNLSAEKENALKEAGAEYCLSKPLDYDRLLFIMGLRGV
ncbi:MAG: response regulator [Gammaproteobacteria bacterium]|nr:response regulator [Gammaproteobacteria bacterium]